MIPLILRHAWRSALSMRFRLLAVAVIAASGFAVYVGACGAIENLTRGRDEEVRRGNLADLELRFDPVPVAKLPSFKGIPGVLETESRLLARGRLLLSGDRRVEALAIVVPDTRETRINRLRLLEGRPLDPRRITDIVIEHKLSRFHGVEIGDFVELSLRDELLRLRVRGITSSPEFLVTAAASSLPIPTRGSLGVVFLPDGLTEAGLGTRVVGSLLFTFRPGADGEALERLILKRAGSRLEGLEAISRREQVGLRFFDHSLAAGRVFLPAVAAFFSLTVFPVLLILCFRWITGQRREIGTAMSLGFGHGRLSVAYLIPTLTLLGFAIASGLGLSFFTLRAFALTYARAIALPDPPLWLPPERLAWAAGGVAATMLVATAWPQILLLRLRPMEAVRSTNHLPGGRLGAAAPLLARIRGRLWLRYAVRNLWRNKALSALTVLSVGLGLGLTTSFLICETSFRHAAENAIRGDRWNAAIEFRRPIPTAEVWALTARQGIRAVTPHLRGSAALVAGERRLKVPVGALPASAGSQKSRMAVGRELEPGDESAVVLEERSARDLGLTVGQTVTLQSGDRFIEARVVGIRPPALLPGEIYVPLGLGQRLLGLGDRVTGAFLTAEGDSGEVKKRLASIPEVARVLSRDEAYSEILEASRNISTMIHVAIGLSIPLVVLFIFANFSVTILERRFEYVMLRILGFSDRLVAATISAEVFSLGLLTALVAVPTGWWGAQILTSRLERAWVSIETVASPRDFLLPLVPTLLLLPVAAWPAIRTILRQPLARSLAERRFG